MHNRKTGGKRRTSSRTRKTKSRTTRTTRGRGRWSGKTTSWKLGSSYKTGRKTKRKTCRKTTCRKATKRSGFRGPSYLGYSRGR